MFNSIDGKIKREVSTPVSTVETQEQEVAKLREIITTLEEKITKAEAEGRDESVIKRMMTALETLNKGLKELEG